MQMAAGQHHVGRGDDIENFLGVVAQGLFVVVEDLDRGHSAAFGRTTRGGPIWPALASASDSGAPASAARRPCRRARRCARPRKGWRPANDVVEHDARIDLGLQVRNACRISAAVITPAWSIFGRPAAASWGCSTIRTVVARVSMIIARPGSDSYSPMSCRLVFLGLGGWCGGPALGVSSPAALFINVVVASTFRIVARGTAAERH